MKCEFAAEKKCDGNGQHLNSAGKIWRDEQLH